MRVVFYFQLNPHNSFSVSLYGEPMQVSLLSLTYRFKEYSGKLKAVAVGGLAGNNAKVES